MRWQRRSADADWRWTISFMRVQPHSYITERAQFCLSQTLSKPRLSAWQRKKQRNWQNVCLCMFLLRWRISYLDRWKPRKNNNHIWLSPSLMFPFPFHALLLPKRCLSSAIINLLCALHILVFLTCRSSADHVVLSIYVWVTYVFWQRKKSVLNLPLWKTQRGEFHCQESK